MKDSILYKILRPLIKAFTVCFLRPKYIGKENIPSEGRIILAGTHTNILDCIVLISATPRNIHFLAKNELWKGPKKILFSNLGLIPVDRTKKDHIPIETACKYLNNDKVIGIFPEATTEKGKGLLPFKIGAVKMAHDTGSKIVPFIITGKYKLFSKDLKVIFGESLSIDEEDLEKANDRLRNVIIDMLEVNKSVNI